MPMKVETVDTRYAPRLQSAFEASSAEESRSVAGEFTESWARALVADGMQARASDIHLDPQPDGICVRFRIDGAVHDIATLPQARGLRLLRYFKVAANLDPADSLLPEDSHLQFQLDEISCVMLVLMLKLRPWPKFLTK